MADSSESVHPFRLALCSPLKSFLAALRFLTVIPVSWKSEEDGKFFHASVIWFPVIGLVIGVVTALFVSLAAPFVTVSLLAVLSTLLLGGFSGFLHLDGVADSGDGLLCSRPRKQALAIMRDSRTGAMGVIFLLFLILGKYAALSSLSVGILLPVIFLMPVAGRTAILLSMAILPYARKGDGLGHLFYGNDRYVVALAGLFFLILCACTLSFETALFLLVPVFLTVAMFSFWCFAKLGGATGDTLGAVCEFSELSVTIGAVLYQGTV